MVKGRKNRRRNVHPKKVLMSIEQKSVLKAKGAVRHFVAVNNVNISTQLLAHIPHNLSLSTIKIATKTILCALQ